MDNRKKLRVIGILLVSLGIFILMSLVFYLLSGAPDEVTGEVTHTMGFFGGWISRLLFEQTIGFGCLVFPLLIIGWGINIIITNRLLVLKKIAIYALLFSLYLSVGLALIEIVTKSANVTGLNIIPIDLHDKQWGVIGGWIARQFYSLVGTVGSVIFFPTIVAITLLYAIDVKFGKVTSKIKRWMIITIAFVTRKYNRRLFKPNQPTPSLKELFRKTKKEEKKKKKDFPTIKVPAPKEGAAPEPTGEVIRGRRRQSEPAPTPPVTEPVGPAASASAEDDEPLTTSRAGKKYNFPDPLLLDEPVQDEDEVSWDELMKSAKTLEEKLSDFGIKGKVVEINPGPIITRFEIEPAPGIKISRFTSLSDDLALVMRAKRIRVVAPIPGKAAIGIEIPNRKPSAVYLRSVIDSARFRASESPLSIALGKTIAGDIFVDDLTAMPHLLIAGATGSGKSVCLNTIITSILFKARPTQVQFIMIDPKRLELSGYSALKHHHLAFREDLGEEVVTTAANAVAVLRSLELEMERRYELLAKAGVRNIEDYNKFVKTGTRGTEEQDDQFKPLEYIVLIIDELADLMLTAAREVEEPIARLTQMSRAVGIHLIVATQRPSVDVITGVIKANFPARMAFQVASKTDSRTILDMNGAEKLLGKGDMLFVPPGSPEPIRIHCAYISHQEVLRVIKHIQQQPIQEPKFKLPAEDDEIATRSSRFGQNDRDELFIEALKLVVRHQQGSVSLLQRRLKIGYARAARLIDQLEDAGYVGPFDGSKAREVLIDDDELMAMGLY